jgi:hypothetical protein
VGLAEVEPQVLKAAARPLLSAGRGGLDLGLAATDPGRNAAGGGPLPITSRWMGCRLDALERGYRIPGFADTTGGDEVFRPAGAARISHPGLQA